MSLRHSRTWFLIVIIQLSRSVFANALMDVLCMCSNSSRRHDFDESLFRKPMRDTRRHSLRIRWSTCKTHRTEL
jgi:hypothetical protein